MKTLLLVTFGMFVFLIKKGMATDTTNPVQSYAAFHGLTGRVVYRWNVDLNNDGKNDALLDTKLTPAEIKEENNETKGQYDPNVHGFEVYIAKSDGSGYVESTGVNDGTELGLGLALEANITRCFVGNITQLSQWGLVTIQNDYPRDGTSVAYIYAYTIDGDHLKRTQLAQYDPSESNAIYDQYLSDSHRTTVTLQEVSP
jgi:hypothetical protein